MLNLPEIPFAYVWIDIGLISLMRILGTDRGAIGRMRLSRGIIVG